MTTLHLNLKKKWFDMLLAGIKKEEYREIKEFFINKFILDRETMQPCHKREVVGNTAYYHKDMRNFNFFFGTHPELTRSESAILYLKCYGVLRKYDTITFSNGYAKDRPQLVIELKGIEIREGKPEWGAEPGKKYFVLKTGQILSGGIDWEQKELASRIEHSNEYFIDGYVNGIKKYEAIGVYTMSGNDLEEIKELTEV